MLSLTPHRLRKHADYQIVYKAGRKQFAKQIAYFHALRPPLGPNGKAHRSDTPGPRIGLTVPKALGKAVDRNRIKRRMREAVRANLALVTHPVDIILHPRRSVIDLDFQQLKREVAQIFRSVQAGCDKAAQKTTAAVTPA
jgi:ribonuclease P protein component